MFINLDEEDTANSVDVEVEGVRYICGVAVGNSLCVLEAVVDDVNKDVCVFPWADRFMDVVEVVGDLVIGEIVAGLVGTFMKGEGGFDIVEYVFEVKATFSVVDGWSVDIINIVEDRGKGLVSKVDDFAEDSVTVFIVDGGERVARGCFFVIVDAAVAYVDGTNVFEDIFIVGSTGERIVEEKFLGVVDRLQDPLTQDFPLKYIPIEHSSNVEIFFLLQL